MKWIASSLVVTLALLATIAHAQDGVTPAPYEGVLDAGADTVSVDAHNQLLAKPRGSNPDGEYVLFVPRHLYSGAFARAMGGDIISTEKMVIPESALRFGMGMGQPGFGGTPFFSGTGTNQSSPFGVNTFGNNPGQNNFNQGNRWGMGPLGSTMNGFPSIGNFNSFNPTFGANPLNQFVGGNGAMRR